MALAISVKDLEGVQLRKADTATNSSNGGKGKNSVNGDLSAYTKNLGKTYSAPIGGMYKEAVVLEV